MITIVRITVQQKNKERFNVFIDKGNGEEYGFSIDQDVFIEFQLKKGNTYSDEEINEILYKDEIKKAYNLSLHYLSFRMRSEKEIYDYLRSKEYADEVIAPVLQKLHQINFVNDLEFAKSFVRSRIQNSTKGPAIIKQELYIKGISESIIVEALNEYPEEKQLEIAAAFAEKNIKAKKNISDYQLKQKIGQALIGRGFSREIVQSVLSQVAIEKDDEERVAAVFNQGQKALRKYGNKHNGFELKQKIKQSLYQRGFRGEDIEVYLNQLQEEGIFDAEII